MRVNSATSNSSSSSYGGNKQRVQTTTSTGSSVANTTGIKLKKSDTTRGAMDYFPKSQSTDKSSSSRIENFLSHRNSALQGATNANNNVQDNISSNDQRVSHSYRTKAEMLTNSHVPHGNSAGQNNGNSMLQSTHNNIKSHSAAPIKLTDVQTSGSGDHRSSSQAQKSDLRQRFVLFLFYDIAAR
jgi:hypothetical protein